MTLRTEFNPGYEFVVTNPRGLIVGSTLFKPGDAFDKGLVPTRTLRQLYDARQLDRAPEHVAVAGVVAPVEVPRPSRVRRRRFSDGGAS